MVHTWCTQKCLQKRIRDHCMVCKESLVSLCGPHTESAFTARSARRVWNHSALCKQSLVSLHGLQLESCMTAVCEKSLLSRYGLQQESDITVASGTSVRFATSVWHHSTVCNECLASQPGLQTKSVFSAVSAWGSLVSRHGLQQEPGFYDVVRKKQTPSIWPKGCRGPRMGLRLDATLS